MMSLIEKYKNSYQTDESMRSFTTEFLKSLKERNVSLYLVLSVHPDTPEIHKVHCTCDGDIDDCNSRPPCTLSFVISSMSTCTDIPNNQQILSKALVTRSELINTLFVSLTSKQEYPIPASLDEGEGILYTYKMTSDNRFEHYNNHFRLYCDLEYFDMDKLYNEVVSHTCLYNVLNKTI